MRIFEIRPCATVKRSALTHSELDHDGRVLRTWARPCILSDGRQVDIEYQSSVTPAIIVSAEVRLDMEQ
jgi:hypothetical protein